GVPGRDDAFQFYRSAPEAEIHSRRIAGVDHYHTLIATVTKKPSANGVRARCDPEQPVMASLIGACRGDCGAIDADACADNRHARGICDGSSDGTCPLPERSRR